MMYGKVDSGRLIVAKRVFTSEGLFEADSESPLTPLGWFLFDGELSSLELDGNSMPVITRRQLLLSLLALGITEAQVDAVIEAIPVEGERELARIYWRETSKYNRNHPLIAQIASTLSLTTEQVDQAWVNAPILDSET